MTGIILFMGKKNKDSAEHKSSLLFRYVRSFLVMRQHFLWAILILIDIDYKFQITSTSFLSIQD